MASEVEICNRALQKLGSSRISSLSDNSVEARACNVAYEPVRDALLEDHLWSFAIARSSLAADATEPDWGRANSFPLPSDFIRLAEDYPEDNFNTKDWVIEGRKIYTDDADPLYIRYVYRVTDPNEMTSLFREALSNRLALELCEELTQSNTKKEALREDYRDIIARARKSNAFQQVSATPPEDEWITVRR